MGSVKISHSLSGIIPFILTEGVWFLLETEGAVFTSTAFTITHMGRFPIAANVCGCKHEHEDIHSLRRSLQRRKKCVL